jgi:predicted Zn-dependent peptidase
MYDYVRGISAVTAEHVKAAAAKYFQSNNSTTALLIPEGGAQ